MRFAILTALASPAFVLAQDYGGGGYGGPAPASTAAASAPSPSVSGQHIIQVAPGTNLVFSPNNITANVGETVTFIFPNSAPITHSVTQSAFAKPCNLLNEAGGGPIGFDSSLQSGTQFTLTITNSTPIWFFCKQPGPPSHCGSGMVGAINAPLNGTNTFQAFQQAAAALGGGFAKETGSGALSGVGAAATAPAASVAAQNSPSSATGLVAVGSTMLFVLAASISLLA